MPNSLIGPLPNQVPRNSDLGRLAYLNPEDLAPGFLHVREEQPRGTNGGTSTNGTYHDRVLNTVVANSIPGASLASNQVTLPAGTYEVFATAPSRSGAGGGTVLFLYNVTDSVDLMRGENGAGTGNINTLAFCRGRFTLSSTKVLKLRHYIGAGQVTDGLGGVAAPAGAAEVYSSLELRKVA
jgi:hypothetical protein